MHRIRHVIQTQHQHERQWWDGRVSLIRQQARREEGRRKLNSVLLVFSFSKVCAGWMSHDLRGTNADFFIFMHRASVGGRIDPVADTDVCS